jgi:hypothetical protein
MTKYVIKLCLEKHRYKLIHCNNWYIDTIYVGRFEFFSIIILKNFGKIYSFFESFVKNFIYLQKKYIHVPIPNLLYVLCVFCHFFSSYYEISISSGVNQSQIHQCFVINNSYNPINYADQYIYFFREFLTIEKHLEKNKPFELLWTLLKEALREDKLWWMLSLFQRSML